MLLNLATVLMHPCQQTTCHKYKTVNGAILDIDLQ